MPDKKRDITKKKNPQSPEHPPFVSFKNLFVTGMVVLCAVLVTIFIQFNCISVENMNNYISFCTFNLKNSTETSSNEDSVEPSESSGESHVNVTSVEEPHQPSPQENPQDTSPQESPKDTSPQESPGDTPPQESPGDTPSQESPGDTPSQESPGDTPPQESPGEIFVVSDGTSGNILTTGTCGENLQYNFNMDSGTLIITGTGDMFDNFVGFQHQNEIKTVSLGSDVTGICENAFESCDNLETVTMADDSKTKIGKNAFLNCTSLREVHLSKNLKKLGSFALNGCTALEEITIPDTIAQIYNNTFAKCIKLKSVHLSQNITKIDEEAFIGCNKNILTIYAPKGSYAEFYADKNNINFAEEGAAVETESSVT